MSNRSRSFDVFCTAAALHSGLGRSKSEGNDINHEFATFLMSPIRSHPAGASTQIAPDPSGGPLSPTPAKSQLSTMNPSSLSVPHLGLPNPPCRGGRHDTPGSSDRQSQSLAYPAGPPRSRACLVQGSDTHGCLPLGLSGPDAYGHHRKQLQACACRWGWSWRLGTCWPRSCTKLNKQQRQMRCVISSLATCALICSVTCERQ